MLKQLKATPKWYQDWVRTIMQYPHNSDKDLRDQIGEMISTTLSHDQWHTVTARYIAWLFDDMNAHRNLGPAKYLSDDSAFRPTFDDIARRIVAANGFQPAMLPLKNELLALEASMPSNAKGTATDDLPNGLITSLWNQISVALDVIEGDISSASIMSVVNHYSATRYCDAARRQSAALLQFVRDVRG